jgi:cell fate regulator YaaT (PSP1 superfamily)
MASNSDKSQEKVFKDKSPETHRRNHKIKSDDGVRSYDLPAKRTVHVRIRYGGRIQVFDCGDLELDIGDWVVIKDFDVLRIGLVTSKPIIWPADQHSKRVLLPTERLLIRLATQEDLAKQAENQLKEREGLEYCQVCIDNQKLVMKLVAVEVTFDNYKTIFYYTADDRVDFRQLVKELVSRFRTRIEMRQIGVRHEALMVGGMGVCGRPFCCSGFLSSFSPVSVKMAKEQNLNLNTVKISGVCGRLMCCLAFENFTVDATKQDSDETVPPDEQDDPGAWPPEPQRLSREAPDPADNFADAETAVDAEEAKATATWIRLEADTRPTPPPKLIAEIKSEVEAQASQALADAQEIGAELCLESRQKPWLGHLYADSTEAEPPEAKTTEAECPEAKTSAAECPEAKTSEAEPAEAKTSAAECPEAKMSEAEPAEAKTSEAEPADVAPKPLPEAGHDPAASQEPNAGAGLDSVPDGPTDQSPNPDDDY